MREFPRRYDIHSLHRNNIIRIIDRNWGFCGWSRNGSESPVFSSSGGSLLMSLDKKPLGCQQEDPMFSACFRVQDR